MGRQKGRAGVDGLRGRAGGKGRLSNTQGTQSHPRHQRMPHTILRRMNDEREMATKEKDGARFDEPMMLGAEAAKKDMIWF